MSDKLTISEAKRIRILFKKQKALFRAKEALSDFKEPVLFLIRRSGNVEFFEEATKGKFIFEHSLDEEDRYLILEPNNQVTFDYGTKRFRGYICHEDYPLPITVIDPILTTEVFHMAIEKALNDIRKWQATELRAKADIIWKALAGIALIGGVYVLYKMLVKEPPTPTEIQNITNNVTQIIANATNIAQF